MLVSSVTFTHITKISYVSRQFMDEMRRKNCWSACGSREHRHGLCHCPRHTSVLAMEIMHNLSYSLLLPANGNWHVKGSLYVCPGPHVFLLPRWFMGAGFQFLLGFYSHGCTMGFCVFTLRLLPEQLRFSCPLAFSVGSRRICPRGEQPSSMLWIPVVKWHSKSLFYSHLAPCLF